MRRNMRDLWKRTIITAVIVALATPLLAAVSSISGTVKTRGGEPASRAGVTLVELKRTTRADEQGAYRFDGIPPGKYLIEIVSPRYGSAVSQVVVAYGQDVTADLLIDLTVHQEQIVVSAGASPQSLADVAQSVAVLDDRELAAKVAPTIGETLAEEPGVNQTFYAPGASRPIIRGLGGDRIRVLQDGIGVGDASSVSPDHAVSYDPYAAERVEVVRGAATLLYGSNAIGGVVNVLDGRVPDHKRGSAFGGRANFRYGSNSDLSSGAANLEGDLGSLGWHADYAKTKTDDYEAGGDFGVKANSDLEIDSGSVGASWLGETAWIGAGYNQYETNYGSAFEEEVRLDMTQKRWDVRGGINAPFGPFRFLKARLGGTDYEHAELEGAEVGTTFFNESLEGRVELGHRQAGAWSGSFGTQGWTRDSEAVGEEAFVAPATSDGVALFAFEEVGTGALKGQFGLRYEQQAADSSDAALRDRDFDAPSASVGLIWKSPGETYSVGATLSHSSRVPTLEELYANGVHVATQTFEVGDPDLGLEKGLGIDVALRKISGRVDGEVNFFFTDFDDYIFERDSGTSFTTDEGDVVPIVVYSPAAAQFWGAETHLDFGLLHAEPHHLDLELRGDYVRAELTDSNEPVPFQPPLRGSLGLHYQGRSFWSGMEVVRTEEQDRFGSFDTTTPGYTWVNASVGYRLLAGNVVHDFVVRGTNLTDDLSFASTSRFRFDVPLPGREVAATYGVRF